MPYLATSIGEAARRYHAAHLEQLDNKHAQPPTAYHHAPSEQTQSHIAPSTSAGPRRLRKMPLRSRRARRGHTPRRIKKPSPRSARRARAAIKAKPRPGPGFSETPQRPASPQLAARASLHPPARATILSPRRHPKPTARASPNRHRHHHQIPQQDDAQARERKDAGKTKHGHTAQQ